MCFYGFSNLNSSSVCRLMRHRAMCARRGAAQKTRQWPAAVRWTFFVTLHIAAHCGSFWTILSKNYKALFLSKSIIQIKYIKLLPWYWFLPFLPEIVIFLGILNHNSTNILKKIRPHYFWLFGGILAIVSHCTAWSSYVDECSVAACALYVLSPLPLSPSLSVPLLLSPTPTRCKLSAALLLGSAGIARLVGRGAARHGEAQRGTGSCMHASSSGSWPRGAATAVSCSGTAYCS